MVAITQGKAKSTKTEGIKNDSRIFLTRSSFRILNLLQASLKSLMTVEGLNVPGSPIRLSCENLYHNAADLVRCTAKRTGKRDEK
jgi:hypothetical protein